MRYSYSLLCYFLIIDKIVLVVTELYIGFDFATVWMTFKGKENM